MSVDLETLKRPLLALRSWPPLNHPVTAVCRAGIRLLGRPPGALARFLPRAGLVEAPLPNGHVLRLWSRADDDVTPHVYWKGWAGHEAETSPLFYEHARSARTTLDIGAHVGYFALLAAHANPAGRVHAFEPHPVVFERLAHNVTLNGLKNVSCEQKAIGAREGRAQFFHATRIGSSSSLSREFMESIVAPSHLASSEVEVVSVDEFVEDNHVEHVDLVKIDTETTEDEVLQGMVRTLERDRPVVFCEVIEEDTAKSIEAIVQRLGYQFFLLTEDGPVKCDAIQPRLPWRNYCFVPAGKALADLRGQAGASGGSTPPTRPSRSAT